MFYLNREQICLSNLIFNLSNLLLKIIMSKSNNQLKFLFRADKTNVGDWVCPPFHYFPFRPNFIGDVINIKKPHSEYLNALNGFFSLPR